MRKRFVVHSLMALACLAFVGTYAGELRAADDHNPKAEGPHTEKGEGADHGHEPGAVPLDFKADLALWSGVTFIVFILVLGKFAWKALIAGLDKRESGLRDNILAAEGARLNAEKMLADHAAKLDKVHDEVREILAEARRDAEHSKQEIIAEAQKEAEASKRRSVAEIERARDAALKDLFDVMATQVANATEHVLARSVNNDDQKRLIQEALAQFPRN